ncbi:hypothetical protein [Nocardia sp. CA-120079]|uniref:hypothetical protein n=1 Tax=Nocardia sp. CA-120079 TaxID=3239974 RepID=UPI003D96E178
MCDFVGPVVADDGDREIGIAVVLPRIRAVLGQNSGARLRCRSRTGIESVASRRTVSASASVISGPCTTSPG